MTKKGILGRKIGMTQIFKDNGELIPVTVVEVQSNVVMQVKTMETDGYEAIQLGLEDKRETLANKPEQGHAAKAETSPKRFIKEINDVELGEYEVGQELNADVFEEGDIVDVTGTSKGHGFQGHIKRHGQSRGPETHGSRYHRRSGSQGNSASAAGRTWKGMPGAGRMGGDTVTIQNLEIVRVDTEKNVLLIKGNVPGAKKSLVKIRTAEKAFDTVVK